MTAIYLIRHATPDTSGTHIPYDKYPGPPLSLKGEKEADRLGQFIQQETVVELYHSPFARCKQTAQIISKIARTTCIEDYALREWGSNESENDVNERLLPVIAAYTKKCSLIGSIGVVTHGGLIKLLLKMFRIEPSVLNEYQHMYESRSPLPPAGVWAVTMIKNKENESPKLVFVPD